MGFWTNILDRSIFFSFGNFGFKRHSRHFAALDESFIFAKHFLITGGSSGIGRYLVSYLLDRGAKVTVLSRGKVDISHANMCHVKMDLADYKNVPSLIKDITIVDVLVNNAGGMPGFSCRENSLAEDIFASQVFGHYVLTKALINQKKLQENARIIFVSSGGMYLQRLDLSDLRFEKLRFNKYRAYANAKRAQVILNELLAEKYPQYTWACMHPGWVNSMGVKKAMPWFYYLMWPFLRTKAQGADSILYLAISNDQLLSGKFYFDRKIEPFHLFSTTLESKSDRNQLLILCEAAYNS